MRDKSRQSGYALLLVFLLAALVALSLYSVMPRAAFEAQRDQEQLLVDRGSQYKRAIQLYYHKFRRYPVKMEDLENSNGQRFLRQRYVDPLTGKNEWRLIHVGPNGAFIDSLTQKSNAPTTKTDTGSVNTFVTEFKAIGDTGAGSPDNAVPIGMRRRPSDPGGVSGTDPNQQTSLPDPTQADNANASGALNNFNSNNSAPAFNPSSGTATYTGNSGAGNYVQNNGTGAGLEVGGTPLPAGVVPDANGYVPGGEMNPNAPQNQVNPNNTTALTPGAIPSGSAGDVIRNLLTSPRPGGPPPGIFTAGNGPPQNIYNPSGRPMTDVGFADGGPGTVLPQPTTSTPVGGTAAGSSSPFSSPGQAVGSSNGGSGGFATGSFAGVASTVKRPSIKIYNDHQKYNEWEFIYDYGKEAAAAAGLQPGGANPLQNQNGQNGLNGPGQTPGQQQSQNPFSSGSATSPSPQPTTPNQ
jgi:hypothetical protein